MSRTHTYSTPTRPAFSTGSGGGIVKIAVLAAIVAVFGLAAWLMVGRPESPVAPTARNEVAAAQADAAKAQSTPQEQPVAANAEANPAASANASAAPADQPAAAPAQQQAAAEPAAAPPAPTQAAAPAAEQTPAATKADNAPVATASAAPADNSVDSSAPPLASADSNASTSAPAAAAPKKAHHKAKAAPAADNATATAAAAPSADQAAPKPDAASTLNPWWTAGGAQEFKVTAVSPAQGEQSLVVAFSEPVDASAAGAHLKLLNNDGSPAAGSWSSGANPRVLVRKDLSPGRYMLFIDSATASANGKALGADMSGPAYVLASR